MKCPKCGGQMSIGAPHDEGYIYQYECHSCGYIIGVCKGAEGDCNNAGNPFMMIGDRKVFWGFD